jgi:Zn-dependent peptidase ImmA (M78 family)/transcriptional regulator with XRE-family HTH domain
MTFDGRRLREAREARGLSIALLAGEANLSRMSVQRFESGQQRPASETVVALADALRVPVSFFAQPTTDIPLSPVFYRSLTTIRRAMHLHMAERLLGWTHRIVSSLESYVELPPVKLPREDVPSDPSDLTMNDVERLAERARVYFNLGDGAISNVGWLLENRGCVVVRNALGLDGIDAFSQRGANDRPIIVLGRFACSVRHQFDYAHELGHLILHRNIDKKYLAEVPRYRLIEDQAHRFASAFLLPADYFRRSVGKSDVSLNGLLALKKDWLVSVAAMVKRSGTIGLISKDEERMLWIAYLKRGWKRREPLDDMLRIDPPCLLAEAISTLREAEPSLFRQWLSDLHPAVPLADVASISGTPEEWYHPNAIAPARTGVRNFAAVSL